MPINEREVVLRLGLAFLAGAFIGLERRNSGKPAGMRTHALVGLGAALFTIISIYGFLMFAEPPYSRTNMDPARVVAQIVVGVGFIGGGLIFKERDQVSGLTTAASIWLTAGLGTGMGVGLYFATTVTALLAFVALRLNRILKWMGYKGPFE